MKRTLSAAETIGVRAMVLHALSERAKRFYEGHGFRASATDPMDLMIPLDEAARVLADR